MLGLEDNYSTNLAKADGGWDGQCIKQGSL